MTLVQTILKRSISSRFGNVSPYTSVFQDKVLAELAKEVCVVCAADYSNVRSVKGDSVTQALICYKNSKRRSQAMYSEGEHSTGNFGTIPRGKFGKFCLKSPAVLTPRVHMRPIVEAAVPRRSDELPPPSPSKDEPTDLSLRILSKSFFSLSNLALKAATSSSDTTIIPSLAVPALGAVPAIFNSVIRSPDGDRKSLYVPPDSQKCVYVAPLARLNT